MLATAVIVFREVLEAALLIGILAAATRSVPGRARWLAGGIALGLAGACLVALGTDRIAQWAAGIGQELFNAAVLGLAVLMLAWHNLWMSAHGAALAADARSVGRAVHEGRRAGSVLLAVAALAVLREGAETVLFLYGIAAAEDAAALAMLLGGALGLAGGVAVGYLLYAGLLRVPLRWFFTATGVLVLFLAAGLAAQAAGFLIQADLLPALAAPVWDSSAWLPQSSLLGTVLHSLIGYDAQPAGMQLVFYLRVLVLVLIGGGMLLTRRSSATPQATRAA